LPPDVRKASGFPSRNSSYFLAAARLSLTAAKTILTPKSERQSLSAHQAAKPPNQVTRDRKGKAFPHIKRQSRKIK